MPYQCAGIRQLYDDTVNDRLIAAGLITLTNNYGATVLASYNGAHWDTLGAFSGWVYSVLSYADTLLVGGAFSQVNNDSISLVAAYYDDTWHPFGDFDFSGSQVRKLKIVNGMLYAVGAFLDVDGHECHGVAKRVGGHWENMGSIQYPQGNEPIVLDICGYEGNIIIGGELNPIGLGDDLLQFNGADWEDVGGGLAGTVGSVTALEVFNGELYVGGGLYASAGSPGHGLVRWNGSTWRDVGGSMLDIYGSDASNASASSFLQYDGKLYVGGAFGYAGDVHANQFAIWDGDRWCATGDSIGALVESMAYYHDTLYVTCGSMLHEEPANYIARWLGGDLEQVCGAGTGLAAVPEREAHISIGQEVDGGRNIFGLPSGAFNLAIYDATGRRIGTQTVRSAGGVASMDQPFLANGMYVVHVEGNGLHASSRFVVGQ